MVWGLPVETLLQIHVWLSAIGIVTGIVALYGLLTGHLFGLITGLFLLTTLLTSVTGFPLPPYGIDPPRILGIISLVFLALAIAAIYLFKLAGHWRWIFVVTAVASLYFNVFVAIVQAFQKLTFLRPLAPTQSEPPFLITQLIALGLFLAFGVVALIRFRPAAEARA
jgi:hypothetical protein